MKKIIPKILIILGSITAALFTVVAIFGIKLKNIGILYDADDLYH